MTKKQVLGLVFVIIAFISLIFAIVCFSMYCGKYTFYEYYGGDAYTGIQQAAADTSYNVLIGNQNSAVMGGFFFLLVSFTFTSIGIINLIKDKKATKKDMYADLVTEILKQKVLLSNGTITKEEFEKRVNQLLDV
ncbi:MAG: SHOCT domain-containing protein [Clostridiales bacterium]|nr:SHOCT domain-containing protein [Clostridiales bacterium]